jgi:hypothetical protein
VIFLNLSRRMTGEKIGKRKCVQLVTVNPRNGRALPLSTAFTKLCYYSVESITSSHVIDGEECKAVDLC